MWGVNNLLVGYCTCHSTGQSLFGPTSHGNQLEERKSRVLLRFCLFFVCTYYTTLGPEHAFFCFFFGYCVNRQPENNLTIKRQDTDLYNSFNHITTHTLLRRDVVPSPPLFLRLSLSSLTLAPSLSLKPMSTSGASASSS